MLKCGEYFPQELDLHEDEIDAYTNWAKELTIYTAKSQCQRLSRRSALSLA